MSGNGEWSAVWNALRPRPSLRAEGRDCVERLVTEVALTGRECALDFGCGMGYVSEYLARCVGQVDFWDATPVVLAMTTRRLVDVAGATPVDLVAHPPAARYDIIVVHSVVQYFSRAELERWLREWAQLLRPPGCIVISDVPTVPPSVLGEAFEFLAFSLRHGVLADGLSRAMADVSVYFSARRSQPLQIFTERDLEDAATAVGLRLRWLPRNLTMRRHRRSMVLQLP